jgi:hypothetical protein
MLMRFAVPLAILTSAGVAALLIRGNDAALGWSVAAWVAITLVLSTVLVVRR